LAKLFERLLLFRLLRWWRSSPLSRLTQFGFRAGSSTLDAVFVLQSLVSFVCRLHRRPLHACFIDLKKAFPSVSRPAMFGHLIDLGVPRPLFAAIRSFYQLNVTRLRIGSYLSRKFIVTLGLLEASILSPLLFSVVFSFVWQVIDPSVLPGVDSALKVDDVWILAFADDLVTLSPCRDRLVQALAKLDVELLQFNLKMNLVKTEVMTFYPRGVRSCTSDPPIVIRSQPLKEVTSFRYLGVLVSNLGSLVGHIDHIFQRSRVSLHKTVNILRQLKIQSVPRLRIYFLSFIFAQLYGLELLPYSESLITRITSLRNQYLRTIFGLPLGTPSELFYVLWPSYHPALLCLQRRLSFFRRGLKHQLLCVPTSFILQASMMSRKCGWFYDSFLFHRIFCPFSNANTFDFAHDVPALLELVRDEDLFSFFPCAS
jgi:hypothetical protein